MTENEWEQKFVKWARPPSQTEQGRCDNAVSAVRHAVANHPTLKSNTQVFVQGSYRNRVNVRQDSDVDIGVIYTGGTFFYELGEGETKPPAWVGAPTYSYANFKNDLESAIRSQFKGGVTRGNKCIKVRANSYHVDADVVPLFHLRWLANSREVRRGVSLLPDDGGSRVDNYPERLANDWPDTPLHYENGVAMNGETQRRYKGLVRVLKKLRNELNDANISAARPIPGYLIECLVFNAPNEVFTGSWLAIARTVISVIWGSTHPESEPSDWMEVDRIKYLFHSSQPWSKQQAHAFAFAAWEWIGSN